MTQLQVEETPRSTYLAETSLGIAYGHGDPKILHHPQDFKVFVDLPTSADLHTETTRQLKDAAGGAEITRDNGAIILATAIQHARERLGS